MIVVNLIVGTVAGSGLSCGWYVHNIVPFEIKFANVCPC